ncbi:MAG: type II toxin-antitoxin system RelE/ParE family toxin [Acetobacteraceae bacterium]|jgi:phage-related protein
MPVQAYSRIQVSPVAKPVVWIGSVKDDLVAFPEEVVRAVGFAIYEAQKGNKHPNAKPLHSFGGAGVLEIVEDHDGDTYRAVYTVRLAGRVYVLHAFQKKSRHGISTPQAEIDLVKARLRAAEKQHAAWLAERKG